MQDVDGQIILTFYFLLLTSYFLLLTWLNYGFSG